MKSSHIDAFVNSLNDIDYNSLLNLLTLNEKSEKINDILQEAIPNKKSS